MTAESYKKIKGSPDDLFLDTPGHGSATPGNFTRALSDGSVALNPVTGQNWNKFCADFVPHRDAPFITGGQQPFARITAADRDTEELVRDLKLNTREMLNFESAGGIPGIDISAVNAAKNTEVFDYLLWILSLPVTASNGIFFPGRRYEFMEWGGTHLYVANETFKTLHTLPIVEMSGLTLCGAGQGVTTLAASVHANQSHNLIYVRDGSHFTICDLTAEKHTTQSNGSCIRIDSVGAAMTTSIVRDVTTVRGISYAIRLSGNTAASAPHNRIWVERCTVTDAVGFGIWIESCTTVSLDKNIFTGTSNNGITCNTTGTSQPLNGISITNNTMTGASASAGIFVSRSGVYDGSIHKDFIIRDNRINVGSIEISGVNEWHVVGNTMFAGGFYATFQGMAGAHNLKVVDNIIEGGNSFGSGIRFLSAATTITGYEISGGRVHNVPKWGITLESDFGVLKYGNIHDLLILNNSRENAATEYSSIRLHETSANGGHQETRLHDLWLRNTTATAGGNKQLYGIEMTNNGGSTDRVVTQNVYIKGYSAAGGHFLQRGANSVNGGAGSVIDGLAAV